MTAAVRASLRQRADYTHQDNLKTGRHGWMRLTPAYSVKIVEELIGQSDPSRRIFDPFSGTATTALSAAYHGHSAMTTDVNPFLVWLGRAKVANYSATAIAATGHAAARAVDIVRRETVALADPPPIHNIERWWTSDALRFLCLLRPAIEQVTEAGSPERTLLLVAFCRTLIALSNAAFNHQSMSFKSSGQLHLVLDLDMSAIFAEDVRFVLQGAAENPVGTADVVLNDARGGAPQEAGQFDLVITSPPYANRMSYIRELRPYMYWLGFLSSGRDAGDLDWTAIGGTWGAATSRLIEWVPPTEGFDDARLTSAVERIASVDNKNGPLLANYISKYFADMWSHFGSLTAALASDAELHYIVGNSTFYSVLLPVEQIYAAMLDRLGFDRIECRPLRKRNSKKELIEFDVVARWPG